MSNNKVIFRMKTIQVGGHKKNSEIMWAMVDDEDFERVSQYNWSISKSKYTSYAKTEKSNKSILLHRFILCLDFGDKRQVNHIDGNGLNNQRSNIEICSQMYNNQSINKPNSNKGCVAYIDNPRLTKPWHSQIAINKVRYQKYFSTEEEAKKFIAEILNTENAFNQKAGGDC